MWVKYCVNAPVCQTSSSKRCIIHTQPCSEAPLRMQTGCQGSVAAAISAQGDVVSDAPNIRDDAVLQLVTSPGSNGQDICQDIHVAQDINMV